MSRKAKLSSEEKEKFARPRLTVCRAGYGPPRVSREGAGFLEDALVVLSSSRQSSEAVIESVELCAEAVLKTRSVPTIVVCDIAPLLETAADVDLVESECTSDVQLGKKLGKPLVRTLQKVTMGCKRICLIAHGALAPLALKLVVSASAPGDKRRLPIETVTLVRPELSAQVINGVLRGVVNKKHIQLHVRYTDAKAMAKRGPMIRHAFPLGDDALDEVRTGLSLRDKENLLKETDAEGRTLWFVRLEAEMSPRTKQYELRCEDITEAVHAAARPSLVQQKKPNQGDADDHGEARVGAMVIRGSRCVLCRNPKKWKGMRIPSIPIEDSIDKVADGVKALAQCCEVDEDEVIPLSFVAPVLLYRPTGGMTTVYFFKAKYPPPDGPLEDADLSDDEDLYDWYTLDRALARTDAPTSYFLHSAAAVLRAANNAGLLEAEYGGVFGDDAAAVAVATQQKQKEEAKIPLPLSTTNTKKLPVTVLSGFLGAGKTTLMSHVLSESSSLNVAVVVNDMAEVNIDATLLRADVIQSEERMVELTNGCVCCTLREDLLKTLRELAERGTFDCVLIESSGISEPMPVAETFTFTDDDGMTLSSLCDLDTMVTVVDCSTFETELTAVDRLADRGWQAHESDVDRTIAHLLVDQIEFANIIVLNKCDLVTNVDIVETTIRSMNPSASIVRSVRGVVPRDRILKTGTYKIQEAEAHPMWLKEARVNEHTPETLEYGISSFIFRHPNPFHPGRLRKVLDAWLADETVLRAKGITYLGTPRGREHQCILSLAGRKATLLPGPLWWITLDRSEWPPGLDAAIQPLWHGDDHGDRQNELVIIGRHMNHDRVRSELEASLFTLHEKKLDDWSAIEDPFLPEWIELEAEAARAATAAENNGREQRFHHDHDHEHCNSLDCSAAD